MLTCLHNSAVFDLCAHLKRRCNNRINILSSKLVGLLLKKCYFYAPGKRRGEGGDMGGGGVGESVIYDEHEL